MKNKELKVGLFTAVALVMLYYGFDFLKGKDFFASTSKYYAIYDNVDQLQGSSQVYVNGFAVGRVSHIRILQDRQNKVLVELEIDSDIMLGDSTKAILNSDFLGTKSILLSIGKVTTPLQPNDTIYAEVAKGTLQVLTDTAEPVADNLQTTIRKLNTVLDNLAKNSQSLDSMFKRLALTPGLVNKTLINSNEKIGELSASFKATADNLNSTLTDLKPTIRNFQTFSDSLKRMKLNQTIAKTQQTLNNLNETLAKLNNGDNTASKLLTDDSLYVNLNRLLIRVDSLAGHINSNPKHFFAPLGKSQKKIEKDLREQEKKSKSGN